MNFLEIANARQSCRSYDSERMVESNKLEAILQAAQLAPSACNCQPYHFTVCTNATAKTVAKATMSMGMNKFALQAPVMIVVSEAPYNRTAAAGAKLKGIDYRSIDVGIAVAYLTSEACAQGLSTCILGWHDSKKIREICNLEHPVQLVIALGYASKDDKLRTKKRKPLDELTTII